MKLISLNQPHLYINFKAICLQTLLRLIVYCVLRYLKVKLYYLVLQITLQYTTKQTLQYLLVVEMTQQYTC